MGLSAIVETVYFILHALSVCLSASICRQSYVWRADVALQVTR